MTSLTCIILCHNEGSLVGETFFSVIQNLEYLRAQYSCNFYGDLKVHFVLDSSDQKTDQFINKIISSGYSKFCNIMVDKVQHGDPGLSRNYGISCCDTEYLLVIDGDDLISPEFVGQFFRQSSHDFIAHPEYLMTFGEKTLLWRQPKYERIEGREILMISANPYDTCSIGKTSLYKTVLYAEARQVLGFGYEDWHFTLESNFHSIKHDVFLAPLNIPE
jgi:hypothetical protein